MVLNVTSASRTAVTCFSSGVVSNESTTAFEEGHYILHIASPSSSSATVAATATATATNIDSAASNAPLSCALSNHSIQTYDVNTFQQIHSIPQAHDGPITDLTHASPNDSSTCSPLIISSSQDGTIKIFDLRCHSSSSSSSAASAAALAANGAVMQWSLPQQDAALSISLAYHDTLAAVGSSQGHILFYDLRQVSSNNSNNNSSTSTTSNRNNKPSSPSHLGSYVDAHTDEITKVKFQTCTIQSSSNNTNINTNTPKPILLTASEDGLINIFDTSQPSEESALISVLNTNTPLRNVGLFGPNNEGLWCLTGSETMSCWHYQSAQPICDFGGLALRDTLSSLVNNNTTTHSNNSSSSSNSSNIGGISSIMMQSLISCFWDGSELNLVAGDSNGNAAIFRVDAGNMSLKATLTGGHRASIRTCSPHLARNCLITGAEDSRLCEWNLSGNHPTNNNNNISTTNASTRSMNHTLSSTSPNLVKNVRSGGGPLKRGKQKRSNAPY